MRSVKKSKISRGQTNKLSSSQVIDLANTGANVMKSGFDWLNEIEKTKQMVVESQVRIVESNNKLAAELAKFEKDILEIQREFEIEFKKLDDDFKLKNRKLDLMEKMIDKIDKLEIVIKICQKEEGLTSQSVMTLYDLLHKEKLNFTNSLVQLGQN